MTKIEVLDHGYVQFIEHWGSDERIVEAARMSTAKGFLGWGTDEKPGDEKLLKYLYDHKHYTPFEMAGMIVEVQAPIIVFREWQRHRTQSYNELSARYTPIPDVNYIPSIARLMVNAGGSNKQAGTIKDAETLTEDSAKWFQEELKKSYEHSEELYRQALGGGVPKELARLPIPVGRYSRMRASTNLRNWLAFLTLRDDKNAQWEIQMFAKAVASLIKDQFPRTYDLYLSGKQ